MSEFFRDKSELCTVLFGCGGFCRQVLAELDSLDNCCIIDTMAKKNEHIMGVPVFNKYIYNSKARYFISMGVNDRRKAFYEELLSKHHGISEKIISVISPHALVDKNTKISAGVFIGKNAVIASCVTIGQQTIINTACVVEHESQIGSFSHISINATICGRVSIGDNVMVGANATVIDNISVCNNVMIGAGSLVIRNIDEPGVYVGSPCKKIKDWH